jgi:basic amino acid/polyamine antiporter, APA family
MKLNKSLKAFDIFSISIGAMISAGIFVLPGAAFAKVGPAVIISYCFAGICALLGSLSMIELTTAMPKAGGNYYFVSRSLGPLVGTITGFLIWFAISLKSAFAIFGLASLLHIFFNIPIFPPAAALTVVFVILNILGTEKAAKMEILMISILIPLLIVFIICSISHIDVEHFEPFIRSKNGYKGIIATAAFVFISFGGLSNIPSISEEILNPKANIPSAVISSIIIVGIFYILILLITIGTMPAHQLAHSLIPIEATAKITMGDTGFIMLIIAAVLAFLTTANAGIMSASRYPLALSRDKLVPEFVGKINSRYKTPVISIILTGIFIIFSLTLDIDTLAEVASSVLLAMYILVNFSVIILRTSKIQNYKPSFKTPFFPWIQIISIILFIILFCSLGLVSAKISIGLILFSCAIYFLYAKKTEKKYALLHMIERLANKKVTSNILENELKEIIHIRDNVIKDDFDLLIENAPVIDLKIATTLDTFLKTIVEELHKDLTTPKDELLSLFKKREENSSTVLFPFLAIPHIIVNEPGTFKILLARSEKGINFSKEAPAVKSIVALIGSKENRNRHLKTLAAIASIIQEKDFEKDWYNARSPQNLKDIFLLGNRKRTK